MMNDYGFSTYDPQNPNRPLGIVNSKNPIFGPKYADIAKCFRTIHISDTYTPSFKTATLPTPADSYGTSSKRWHEKTLVYQFEHHMGFRPLGYAFFSGKIVKTSLCTITQTEDIQKYNVEGIPSFGGSFTLNGSRVETVPTLPSVERQMVPAYTDTGYDPTRMGFDQWIFVINDVSESYGYIGPGDIKVNDDCGAQMWPVLDIYRMYDEDTNTVENPYTVEIDDTYVKIYRHTYWLDFWLRYYEANSGTGWWYSIDVNDRIKGATSLAGSEVNCTIYLCPYSMEDLV